MVRQERGSIDWWVYTVLALIGVGFVIWGVIAWDAVPVALGVFVHGLCPWRTDRNG